MFNYNLTDYKLYKERQTRNPRFTNNCEFDEEHTTSREDKIAFIDSRTDGLLSYALDLFDKYQNADIKKDSYDYPKTTSLLAWLKKNDTKNIIDTRYDKGAIKTRNICGFAFPERFIYNFDERYTYETYEDYVDETFHKMLNHLCSEEAKHFMNNDPYMLLTKKAMSYIDKFGTFGSEIIIGDARGLTVANPNNNKYRRILTTDELQSIIDKAEKVENLINDLSKNPITF